VLADRVARATDVAKTGESVYRAMSGAIEEAAEAVADYSDWLREFEAAESAAAETAEKWHAAIRLSEMREEYGALAEAQIEYIDNLEAIGEAEEWGQMSMVESMKARQMALDELNSSRSAAHQVEMQQMWKKDIPSPYVFHALVSLLLYLTNTVAIQHYGRL